MPSWPAKNKPALILLRKKNLPFCWVKLGVLLQAVGKRREAPQRKATQFLREAMWSNKPQQQTRTGKGKCMQHR